MATVTRQPFAPLDEARLQSITSLKNRQNGVSPPVGKRKAELVGADDSENLDPLLSFKRAKGSNSHDTLKKPVNYLLTTSRSTTSAALQPRPQSLLSPTKPMTTSLSTPRRTLQPKSPMAKLNAQAHKSTPPSAPAGRSPTRGKRVGLLSHRRRTASPFTRVEPPFHSQGTVPFSLDAALKGTIPNYTSKTPATASSLLDGKSDLKAGWFFDIHEDTPEQEMTNLLQHSTCVLDISSDEETEQKAKRDKDEGRNKENVPPPDDISQISTRRTAANEDAMIVENERVALGEMNTADYFPEGCDESSVIIIPADEGEVEEQPSKPITTAAPEEQSVAPPVQDFDFAPELTDVKETPSLLDADVEVLMSRTEEGNGKAAVLLPIEGTGESFELWESGSDKGETV